MNLKTIISSVAKVVLPSLMMEKAITDAIFSSKITDDESIVNI